MPRKHNPDEMILVSRIDLDLRDDGEPVMKRIRRGDMRRGDVIVNVGEPVKLQMKPLKAHVATEASFQLPEMPEPVRLPANADAQRAEVRRVMEQYRPDKVYGRDYTIGGGAVR